jgi:type I restriction enzyme S subunit
LLLTEGGDPDKLGRGACWRGEIPECIHQNHIFRVRFDSKQILAGFVSAQVSSHYGKSYFLANAKQTTGIATINQRVLTAFPLMIPRLEEQGRVVAALANCTERAERARKAAEDQAAAINAMPAALLRRAFSGEL